MFLQECSWHLQVTIFHIHKCFLIFRHWFLFRWDQSWYRPGSAVSSAKMKRFFKIGKCINWKKKLIKTWKVLIFFVFFFKSLLKLWLLFCSGYKYGVLIFWYLDVFTIWKTFSTCKHWFSSVKQQSIAINYICFGFWRTQVDYSMLYEIGLCILDPDFLG